MDASGHAKSRQNPLSLRQTDYEFHFSGLRGVIMQNPIMDQPNLYCRFLRAKNAFGTFEGGGNPFLPKDPGTTTYWCIRSMSPAGPDGRLAHISTCADAKRSCYMPEIEDAPATPAAEDGAQDQA